MRELSLHLMDIAENSISAGASVVYIEIDEMIEDDWLIIKVIDNGKGMDENMTLKVKDPFVTSRTTRKVGLGLPLLDAASKRCGGDLVIKSQKGEGTEVTATFRYHNIDRAPLGRIDETIISLIMSNRSDIVYKHKVNDKVFDFDTREIKKIVGEDLTNPEILNWLKDYLMENIKEIGGGVWD